MNQPLLSVIIPCYNIEKYLDKCISSIVAQTYTNLEILLINDGSTDNSGMICDAWQEQDQRIRVIHKQNEGSSYARKTGVENATAEYVTFVDADDWIDENMYHNMMSALLSTGSDIAVCDFCVVHEDGRTEHRVDERQAPIQTMGRIEGVIEILGNLQWRTSFFTKIFKIKLFDHIIFPKERGFGEDMIMHGLFHQASQSVFLNCEYYFYRVRSDSITNRQGDIRKDCKNKSDFYDAFYECYSFTKQHREYHKVLSLIQGKMIEQGIYCLRMMVRHPLYFSDDGFAVISKRLRSIPFPKGEKLQRRLKIELFLVKIHPEFYKIVMSQTHWIYCFCKKTLKSLYAWLIRVTNSQKN